VIFAVPPLHTELEVVQLVEELQERLRFQVAEPRRWTGSLRRLTLARAVQGSNSIEGYDASLDDVVAALDDEESLDASVEVRRALDGYHEAMTYVLQLARQPNVVIDGPLVRALHFMMLKYDLDKSPGLWRSRDIYVRSDEDSRVVYQGPPADDVPSLMSELEESLAQAAEQPALVRAAMAHLNLVMIHPFRDGNGRMARCLQTLVLRQEKMLSPEFNSIEEHLGRNTEAYYEILAQVGQGAWHPERDPRPWIRFCLTSHFRQARTLLRRVQETERLWDELQTLAQDRAVPERSVGALMDAAHGLRLRNATYRRAVRYVEGEEILEQTASRDLKALVEADLLVPQGEKRGRIYLAGPAVRGVMVGIRSDRPSRSVDDPFTLIRKGQGPLPLDV
jgi:Fic family protein